MNFFYDFQLVLLSEELYYSQTLHHTCQLSEIFMGKTARIDVFDPFFQRLSALGKSLGISMGETFFLLTSRLRHNN